MLRSNLIELKDYQKVGARFMEKQRYCINADDMGLGKSFQALEVSANTGAKKILILCPASLKVNWQRECNKYFELPYVSIDKPIKEADIIITNYERFIKTWHQIGQVDHVIIDEAHYAKNQTTQRTKAIHQYLLIHRPKYLSLLTGTPIQNRVYEIYSLLRMIDYGPSPTKISDLYKTENVFKDTFCKCFHMFIRGMRVPKYKGVKNVEKLIPLLKDKVIRREKKKVLNLQDTITKDVLISFKEDPKLQKLWEENLRFTGKDSADKALAALNKTDFTAEYVKILMEEINACVVFTDHQGACEALAEKLKAPYIHGGVSLTKRQEIVDGLQSGKYPIIICTIGAAATGWNMTKAHHMVFNDYSWVPGNNAQARDRINRIGQTEICVYHNIYGTVTDEFIGKDLKEKEKTIKAVGL